MNERENKEIELEKKMREIEQGSVTNRTEEYIQKTFPQYEKVLSEWSQVRQENVYFVIMGFQQLERLISHILEQKIILGDSEALKKWVQKTRKSDFGFLSKCRMLLLTKDIDDNTFYDLSILASIRNDFAHSYDEKHDLERLSKLKTGLLKGDKNTITKYVFICGHYNLLLFKKVLTMNIK